MIIDPLQAGTLENELAVGYECEELAPRQQEVHIPRLCGVGRAADEECLEAFDLPLEDLDVREVDRTIRQHRVVELNRTQASGGPLVEEKSVVTPFGLRRNLVVLLRVEEEVGHELHDQRHVDVNGPFELWQGADVTDRHFEVHVLFETLGCDNVPEVVHDLFALGRDLHLDHRVVEQIAAILGGCDAHVVDRAGGKEAHGDQACRGVGQQIPNVREVGDLFAIKLAMGGMCHRFIKGMSADADRGPAEIELADVDGVEGHVPGGGTHGEHFLIGDRVGAQSELGDVHLGLDGVFHTFVVRVVRLDGEENELVGLRVLAEDAEQGGLVAVADVVLAAVRLEGAVRHRCEHHLARVEVGAVGLF